jgi:hypothetical protein
MVFLETSKRPSGTFVPSFRYDGMNVLEPDLLRYTRDMSMAFKTRAVAAKSSTKSGALAVGKNGKAKDPEMVKLARRAAGALKGPSGAKVVKAMGRKLP